jgi:xanthine dehydrogenase accessory factor
LQCRAKPDEIGYLMSKTLDMLDQTMALKATGEPFAVATVVRTVSLTAAKAGAKAVIRRDGSISAGWIGGGCARAAVIRAAREALADGQSRLISVEPPDVLREKGVIPGESRDGTHYASNMCPSQGSMDIFIEPVMPRPELLVCGASPVAVAVAGLARIVGLTAVIAAPAEEHGRFGEVDAIHSGYGFDGLGPAERYIVVATQGRGDEAALAAALAVKHRYLAFVGSRRKAAALRESLAKKGCDGELLEAMRCPAGLDLGAVTPEEIALSIVAEIVEVRRREQFGTTVQQMAP